MMHRAAQNKYGFDMRVSVQTMGCKFSATVRLAFFAIAQRLEAFASPEAR
jgi:hypothetical protein